MKTSTSAQRGVALLVVLAALMLTSIALLGSLQVGMARRAPGGQ